MIQRRRDPEQELADLLAHIRQSNPDLTTVYVVAVEPLDPRFQKWYVGAYADQATALLVANEEYQSFAKCPPGWVDTTVEKMDLAPTREDAPILIQLPIHQSAMDVAA